MLNFGLGCSSPVRGIYWGLFIFKRHYHDDKGPIYFEFLRSELHLDFKIYVIFNIKIAWSCKELCNKLFCKLVSRIIIINYYVI